MTASLDDDLDPEELAYDEYLSAAERGEAPDVDEFLAARGLEPTTDLGDRLREWERLVSRSSEPTPALDGVGPYRFEERLGSGGFGVVHLARQTEPVARQVAVKVLKRGMDSDEILARFEAERATLARMDHPGIARVLDAGTTPDGRPFIAMEYVPGEAITRFCDGARLGVMERIDLVARVCDAVQHAHQKGVVHRDLKPSNVLVRRVDGAPSPKVIDFGVAKAIVGDDHESSFATRAGALVGTLQYMSPEQAAGLEIDTRADVYSLGVLAYELCTGALPIDPPTAARASGTDVVRAVIETAPPPLGARLEPGERAAEARRTNRERLVRELSGDLDVVVRTALEKDPARRYASASEFAAELRRVVSGEPVLARAPSFVYRLTMLARRHRVAATVIGALALSLVAATVVTTLAMLEANDERDRARHAEDMAKILLGEAERSAAEANGVTDFLRSMWAFAKPTGTEDAPVPAVRLLDEAEATLDASLANEPAVRARLHMTLGEIELSLERLDEAEREMRAALALGLGAADSDSTEIATFQHNLAAVLIQRGEWDEAQPLIDEALEIRTSVLGPDHVDVAASLDLVARGQAFRGRREEAAETMQRAWEIAAREFGEEHLETMSFTSNLATYLRDTGRLAEARERMDVVCRVRERELGPEHPETLSALNNLAMLWHRDGRHGEAGETFERVMAAHSRIYGDGHLATARSTNNAATQFVLQGDPERALPLIERALEVFRAELPAGHPTRVATTNNLARTLGDVGRAEDALVESTKALEECDGGIPSGHLLHGMVRSTRGGVLLKLERYDDAVGALETAAEIIIGVRGEADATSRSTLERLEKAYVGAGRANDAADVRARLDRSSAGADE